jgi:S-adenosylmethionine synthetase
MARQNYLFTSESVPKVIRTRSVTASRMRSSIWFTRKPARPASIHGRVRVACETLTTTNRVVIAGEVRVPDTLLKKDKKGNDGHQSVQVQVRRPPRHPSIGYEQDGFHWKTCKIDVLLHFQSADIAQGVDNAADRQGEEGAGDQGIMFGYACRETPALMPAPIYYSHKILELMAAARHKGEGDAGKLGPDAKSQVTIRYETASQPRSPPSWCRPSTSTPRGIRQGAFEVVEPYVRQAFRPAHRQRLQLVHQPDRQVRHRRA